MSNYTKTTNFATKDSLASGNPNKIVKGAEINSEFDNIATAVATKADTASPSLTGTVTAAALNVTGNLDVDGTLEFDSISGTGSVAVTDIADEDNMSSNSATKLATQQSIKAYVDSQVTAQDLDLTDGSSSISIDLDSEALSVLGGTGIDSTASGNGVTLAIDSTVTTLTGSQTLTNKTLTSPDVNTPDIDGGTIDGTVIGGSSAAAGSFTTVGATGNITVGGTVDGRDVATDGTKLDGIEASADVTDTANVTAAGALMDSELTAIASVKALNQGVATTDSPTFAAVTVNGNVEFDGLSGTGSVTVTDILDQDDMSGNSATALATQQSIKAYVDAQQDTVDTLAEILALSNATGGSNIVFGDSSGATDDRLQFGDSQDLSIFHNGSNSFISEQGTGDLYIGASNNIALMNAAFSENKLLATTDGALKLYFNGAEKLATASGGISVTGELTATSLDISGDIDVDGTTNLDVVDIDGAVNMASTLAVGGTVTANAGVVVDNITIDGNEIDVGSGDLTLDVAGDIILDAGGSEIKLKMNGTEYGQIFNRSSDLAIYSSISNQDITFHGNDGGTFVTALTLDMSAAGAATFNGAVTVGGNFAVQGADVDVTANIRHAGDTDTYYGFHGENLYRVVTGGTERLEVSNSGIIINDSGADADFRVESDGNANMLFVDGGNNRVGVGVSNPSATAHIQYTTQATGNQEYGLVINGNDTGTNGESASIFLGSINNTVRGASIASELQSASNNHDLIFSTSGPSAAPTERFRIAADGSLSTPTAGTSNVRFGVNAGNSIASGGNYNVFVGDNAGTAITTGDENIAIGFNSLLTEDTGKFSVAIGVGALQTQNNDGNNYNTAVGHEAGKLVTTGVNNTLIGGLAGDATTTGSNNTAVGSQSLGANTTGGSNVAVGLASLAANTTASENTALGFASLNLNTTGAGNTATGFFALAANTTGANNVANGYKALLSNTTASNNTAQGYFALSANTTGGNNVAVGALALDANTTGFSQVGVGYGALTSNTTGYDNAAFGVNALGANISGLSNTAVGNYALDANTTANNNTAVGYSALGSNTIGTSLVALGTNALYSNTTAANNTAIGHEALFYNTTGSENTAVGRSALVSNVSGSNNTAIAYGALNDNTTGAQNIAVGRSALGSNTTAANNTAVGYNALAANTTGTANVAIGGLAGDKVTTGGSNVILGYNAGVYGTALTTGGTNTLIGSYTSATTADASSAVGLGHSVAAATGYVTIGHGNSDIRAAHGNVTWATVSDERYKKDIADSTTGLSFINALQPRTFKYKTLGELPETFNAYEEGSTEVFKNSNTNHGFIAQEIKAAIDADSSIADGFKLWDDRDDGSQEVAEAALIPVLTKAIQELSAQVDALTARIETLEG